MKQIIKLIDVDGCGTNEETTIQAEGKQKLSNGIIQGIKDKTMECMIQIVLLMQYANIQKQKAICVIMFQQMLLLDFNETEILK